MTQAPPAGLAVERAEWLVSGTVSPMARQQIEALGITLNERAFEPLRGDSTQSAEALDGSETE
jgi:hypothetical protein